MLSIGPGIKIEISLAILSNNAEHSGKTKSNVASLNFCDTKVYSKLNCANKVVPIAATIIIDNLTRIRLCKSLRISSSKWNVTFDFDCENSNEN